jgi:phosphomannomutase
MNINPDIFKAYDVRGLYPSELNEDAARAIGRAFVSYLKAKRIAVGRDMRLSSPSVASAFIEGAREQGADVVDYGMIATDMMYFAVARDGHDGGAQITASHNPKQYNGIKMVRREAFPLSGDAGIGEIRDMLAKGALPSAAATKGSLTHQDVLDDYVGHVMSFIDEKAITPFNVVLDGGSGMAGLVGRSCSSAFPPERACASTSTDASQPRAIRSSRRTGATSWNASSPKRPTSASPGTATPIAASSSTGPASSSRETSSPRSWPKRFC